MRLKSVLLGLCASTVLLGQATMAQQELVWKEQKLVIAKQPQKLAVYDTAALDTLHRLGVKVDVVPKATYPHALATFNQEQTTKAGTLFEPDTAILKAEQPDLIIIGRRSTAAAQKVADIAPVLDLTEDTQEYMADLTQRTEFLANLFAKQEVAQQALTQVREKQAQLKKQTEGKTALMLFTYKGNFMPHAEGERFGFMHELSGLTPVMERVQPLAPGETRPPRPEPGSPEAKAAKEKADARLRAAIEQNPDYLLILDRGALNTNNYTAKQAMAEHPIVSQAKGKVVVLVTNVWYLIGAGLANTELMLDELLEATK